MLETAHELEKETSISGEKSFTVQFLYQYVGKYRTVNML